MEHLSKSQLVTMLGAAKACRDRDWMMLLVGFWHGLRASEVVGLTAGSIVDGYLTVKRLKGSEKTTQPLAGHDNPLLDEATALPAYICGMHRDQRLFPISRGQFWRLMQKYGAMAGVPKHLAHPHILKHSIAMQSLLTAENPGGVQINELQTYLGHKSLASTGQYTKVDSQKASAAIAGAMKAK